MKNLVILISCCVQPSATFRIWPVLSLFRIFPSISRTFWMPDSVYRFEKFRPQYLDEPCAISRDIVEKIPLVWKTVFNAGDWMVSH